jgi:predicted ester cyclase
MTEQGNVLRGDSMSDHQKQLLIRWFEEVWNKGRREVIDEMISPHCIIHDGEGTSTGPEGFKLFFDRMRTTFSNFRVTPQEGLSEGDFACLRWSATMRHIGEGLGMPPSRKEIRTTGMTLVRIKEGKFVEAWQNWDMLGVMQQINEAGPTMTYIGAR